MPDDDNTDAIDALIRAGRTGNSPATNGVLPPALPPVSDAETQAGVDALIQANRAAAPATAPPAPPDPNAGSFLSRAWHAITPDPRPVSSDSQGNRVAPDGSIIPPDAPVGHDRYPIDTMPLIPGVQRGIRDVVDTGAHAMAGTIGQLPGLVGMPEYNADVDKLRADDKAERDAWNDAHPGTEANIGRVMGQVIAAGPVLKTAAGALGRVCACLWSARQSNLLQGTTAGGSLPARALQLYGAGRWHRRHPGRRNIVGLRRANQPADCRRRYGWGGAGAGAGWCGAGCRHAAGLCRRGCASGGAAVAGCRRPRHQHPSQHAGHQPDAADNFRPARQTAVHRHV